MTNLNRCRGCWNRKRWLGNQWRVSLTHRSRASVSHIFHGLACQVLNECQIQVGNCGLSRELFYLRQRPTDHLFRLPSLPASHGTFIDVVAVTECMHDVNEILLLNSVPSRSASSAESCSNGSCRSNGKWKLLGIASATRYKHSVRNSIYNIRWVWVPCNYVKLNSWMKVFRCNSILSLLFVASVDELTELLLMFAQGSNRWLLKFQYALG